MKDYEKYRFNRTINLLYKFVLSNEPILDLGEPTELSDKMSMVWKVQNTDFDLDDGLPIVKPGTIITAFEILEHLLNPYPLLRDIKAKTLIATVPVPKWYCGPYWNNNDEYDQHYHEFFPKQFNKLLQETGWTIIHSEEWFYTPKGIRPFIKKMIINRPAWYAVVAKRG